MRSPHWFKSWDAALGELAVTSMRDGRPLPVDEMLVAWDRDCPDVDVAGLWVEWRRVMVHGRLPDGRLRFYDWCEAHACWEDDICARRGGGLGNPPSRGAG